MFGFGILSCIVFLPLVGAAFILSLRLPNRKQVVPESAAISASAH